MTKCPKCADGILIMYNNHIIECDICGYGWERTHPHQESKLSNTDTLRQKIENEIKITSLPINDSHALYHCSKCGRDANTSRIAVNNKLRSLLESEK